jgi:hypothetical protein
MVSDRSSEVPHAWSDANRTHSPGNRPGRPGRISQGQADNIPPAAWFLSSSYDLEARDARKHTTRLSLGMVPRRIPVSIKV